MSPTLEVEGLAPAAGFLRSASVGERQALFRMAQPLALHPGEVLFERGDPYNGFYAIVAGKMKLYRAGPAGRQLVLALPQTGEIFAEAMLCMPEGDSRHVLSACAMTPSTLLLFPAEPAAAFVRSRPHLYQALMERMGRLLEHVSDHLETVSLYDVRSRLARFLLSKSQRGIPGGHDERAGSRTGNGLDGEGEVHAVRLAMPKSLLAGHLGTVPETLSRTLRAFHNEGLIQETRQEIQLLDIRRLRTLADGGQEG